VSRPQPAVAARRRLLPAAEYGWVIVAALCVTETITWGIIYYGFPVFLRAMEGDLRASRVAVTGAFSLGLGVSALAALPVGRWLDRRGPRLLMTLGSCLGAALVLCWSRVETLAGLYLVWAMMGLAMAATLYEPAFAAVVQWFAAGRDRALLTLTLVAGLASTIFMPLANWLLDRLGWRPALVTLAAVLAVTTIPIHALVLRHPGDSGRKREASAPAPAAARGAPLSAALRRAVFWVLTVAFVIGNFSVASITVHLIPYLGQYGYSAAFGAAAVGWMGAMQLAGRILFVPIASRLGSRWMAASIFLAQGAGMAQLALVGWLPSLIPTIVMLGAANGMSTLARATTVSDIFGRRHYGSISGAMALGANGARALGPIGASLLYLELGGYERLFAALAAALAVAALAVLMADASPEAGAEGAA
jgi:MFS family permease